MSQSSTPIYSLRPRQSAGASHNGAGHVAFDVTYRLGLCVLCLSRLNSLPHTIAVYASPRSSPSATQHSLPGERYPLPAPVFHRLDRASFAWRTRCSSDPSSCTLQHRIMCVLAAAFNIGSERPAVRQGSFDGQP